MSTTYILTFYTVITLLIIISMVAATWLADVINPKVYPIVCNYVNRTTKTALIIGIPFFLFDSLQLHMFKMRKAVKRRWMRGFTGIDEEMIGSANWRKLAQSE